MVYIYFVSCRISSGLFCRQLTPSAARFGRVMVGRKHHVPPEGCFKLDAPSRINGETFDGNMELAERELQLLEALACLFPRAPGCLVFAKAALAKRLLRRDGVFKKLSVGLKGWSGPQEAGHRAMVARSDIQETNELIAVPERRGAGGRDFSRGFHLVSPSPPRLRFGTGD